jgi:peptidoglycan hydrolase-like protein with peptidoglycan-binding domain
MNDKFLTEKGWKDLLASCKGKIKDNGLQRGLWAYEKLPEDKYEDRLKRIVDVAAFAGNLRRAKDVTALPEAVKYVAGVANAAEFERREIISAKEAAEKVAAEAEKREEMERQKSEQQQEEETDPEAEANYRKLGKELKAGLQLVQNGKGKPCEYLVTFGDATFRTPAAGLMIAPKISSQHKQLLTKVTGSKRFADGKCLMEQGKLTFVLDGYSPTQVGLKALRRSIQYFTGKNLPLRLRDQNSALEEDPSEDTDGPDIAEDDDQEQDQTPKPDDKKPRHGESREQETAKNDRSKSPEGDETGKSTGPAPDMAAPLSLSASVGRGGKNKPEDVQAVQAALNKRAGAGLEVDGKVGPKTIAAIVAFQKKSGLPAADGLVEPGKGTEAALNGKAASASEGAKAGAGNATAGSAAKGGGGAGAGESSSKPIGEAAKALAEAALKAAKEAEQRIKQMEQAYLDILKKILKASEQLAGGVFREEGNKIKELLQEAYKKILEQLKDIQKAASDLEKKKTQEGAEALKKLVDAAESRLKAVLDQLQKASEWLKKYSPDIYQGAQDLARQVAKEIAERKKQADDAYNDIVNKLKKAAEDELGPEGKRIKEELEKAYKENQEHLKKVAQAAKDLAARKTQEAAEALKKAAEGTVPGFKTVEDLAQKASDWWNSD